MNQSNLLSAMKPINLALIGVKEVDSRAQKSGMTGLLSQNSEASEFLQSVYQIVTKPIRHQKSVEDKKSIIPNR